MAICSWQTFQCVSSTASNKVFQAQSKPPVLRVVMIWSFPKTITKNVFETAPFLINTYTVIFIIDLSEEDADAVTKYTFKYTSCYL